jgi:hypothetical protein
MVAAAALFVAFVLPRKGVLIVTLAGPGGKAVDGASVLVDGAVRCAQSPCRVDDLAPGAHTVGVQAPGYTRPADRAIVIESGSQAVVDFVLAGTVGATGVRVGALGKDLRLFVDGKDRGLLPVTVTDLETGDHAIRITGNPNYRDYQENISLRQGQLLELAPKLTVLKRVAELQAGPGADAAEILLVCGDDKQLILDLPKTVEVPSEGGCRVEATREGYKDLVVELEFDAAEAEKTFKLALAPVGVEPAGRRPTKPGPGGSRKPAPAAGGGTISVNSIPPSNVLVDGRPIGKTPTRVNVTAGRHTVVFMHPQKGKRSRSVNVKSGQNAVAAVKF